MISIIVAIAENFAIGKNNDLLWHIPDDLKRFKQITTGHAVIMGKKTYESLPFRPLKNRRNIVITDNVNEKFEGCETVYSIKEALEKCDPSAESFIIGGASVYQQFLPYTDRLYLTLVHQRFDGDVFFPEFDLGEWSMVTREDFPRDGQNEFSYSCILLDRKK
jgi:dihydrofolate reductase